MKADLLRAERIQLGWSQAKLAEALGVDTRTVRRWERGQAVPFPYYRKQLSTLFGKTPEELGLSSDIDESNAAQEASPFFSQQTALVTDQQLVQKLEVDLLEDYEQEDNSLDQAIAYHALSSDEPIAQEQVVSSLVGHFEAHQHSVYSSEDHLFLFRSLWDVRIHMRSRSSSQSFSNRFFPRPLRVISVILLVALVIVLSTVVILLRQPSSRSTHVEENYAPPSYTLTIPTLDPSLQNIAQNLQQAFFAVYPQLVNRFARNPAKAARNVTLTFSSNLSSPAAISGTTIILNLNWIRQHPTDTGLLTYELTLLVQQYPSGAPAWFSDGMADYARYVYGPADDDWSLPASLQPKDSYTQGGGVAARFLLWLEQYTTLDIVDQLNHALQAKQSFSSVFYRLTHQTVNELWSQYTGYPVITITPQQLYKSVTSRRPLYQSSFLDVKNTHPNTFNIFSIPNLYLSNFALQADMTIVHGAAGGLIFRFNDENYTGERLRVSTDGSYDLVNQKNSLIAGFSPAIKQGLKQTNRLTIIVQRHTIYLYINGQFINQVDDSSYNYGQVGILAIDWGEATDVHFEKIQIF